MRSIDSAGLADLRAATAAERRAAAEAALPCLRRSTRVGTCLAWASGLFLLLLALGLRSASGGERVLSAALLVLLAAALLRLLRERGRRRADIAALAEGRFRVADCVCAGVCAETGSASNLSVGIDVLCPRSGRVFRLPVSTAAVNARGWRDGWPLLLVVTEDGRCGLLTPGASGPVWSG